MPRKLQQLKRDLAKVTGTNTRFGEEVPPKPKNKWRRRLRNAALITGGAIGAGLLYKHGPDLKLTHNASRIAGDIRQGVKKASAPSRRSIDNLKKANDYNKVVSDSGKTSAQYSTDLANQLLKEKVNDSNYKPKIPGRFSTDREKKEWAEYSWQNELKKRKEIQDTFNKNYVPQNPFGRRRRM